MAENVLAPIEELVLMIPGTATPLGRAAVFGVAGSTYAYAAKPELSFKADGSVRPWVFFEANHPEATWFPYWAWGVVPAVLFGVLI